MSFALKTLLRPVVLAGLLALTGCGFHPLYGPQSGSTPSITARMDEIDIGLLANRQGQLLHQALERDLYRDGAPGFYRYHLRVTYGFSVQAIGIQQDSSNTRNRYIATASWVLTPEGNRQLAITKGTAQAMDAVNIIDNQYFASTLDAGTMRHQLAREIARQMTTELAIYFRKHPDKN